ncbi:nucleotidyltransferase family protein [bacterium]|nr:nucleotidyltransferase family protein [bacterium]MBU1652572.1 nucleotidyltransferase family protein [bacterium]
MADASKQYSLEEIKALLKKSLKHIRAEYHVKSIGLFGSYVHGEALPDSDLDVLVDFSKPIGLFKFLELEEYLSDLLKIKIDLVSKNALKPRIGKRILEEAVYL